MTTLPIINKFKVFFFSISLVFLLILVRCAGRTTATVTPTDSTSASEIIAAAVGGAVNATSSTGFLGLNDKNKPSDKSIDSMRVFITSQKSKPSLLNFAKAINPLPQAIAGPTPTKTGLCAGLNLTSGVTCTPLTNLIVFSYNFCSFYGSNSVWTGTQVLALTSGTTPMVCNTFPGFQPGDILVRTFGPNTLRTFYSGTANGTFVLLETSNLTNGWSTPTQTRGETIVFGAVGARTITINGLHVAYEIPNYVIWDHMITSTDMAVSAGDAVTSGTVTVQMNKTREVATASVAGLTFTGCCQPISGTITTTFANNTSATETMVFGPACGAATLNGRAVTLNHCF